jgi:hypothetical protein
MAVLSACCVMLVKALLKSLSRDLLLLMQSMVDQMVLVALVVGCCC